MAATEFGSFVRCGICHGYDFERKHRCPPMFRARFDHDDEDGWRTVHARDAEEAAARFCEEVDAEGDYHVIRNAGAIVFVRQTDSDPWRTIQVSAETRPHYTGREEKAHG